MSAAPAQQSIPSATHSKKDASHAAFYAGFLKGAISAIDGTILFIKTPALREKFREMIVPLCNAQASYIIIFTLSFFILSRGQPQTMSDFYHGLNRWSRTLTIVLSFFLDVHRQANEYIFYSSFKLITKDEKFSSDLENLPNIKKSFRAYLIHFKRLIKLAIYKSAATILKYILPGGHYVAIPMVRFVSLVPTLGTPVAGLIACIHLLPSAVLQSSSVDDFLLSFGEAIVDADECGQDLLKKYIKKLNPDVRDYFIERYRAYIVGFGFVFSFLSSIPFLGIPFALISECGAAYLITDITKRNLDKRDRMPLPAEQDLVELKEQEQKTHHDKTS